MSVVKVFLAVLNCSVIPLEALTVIVSMGTKLAMITTLVFVRSLLDFDDWHCLSWTDISECATQNGRCEQNCQNTVGNYSGSRLTRYLMDINGCNSTIYTSFLTVHSSVD